MVLGVRSSWQGHREVSAYGVDVHDASHWTINTHIIADKVSPFRPHLAVARPFIVLDGYAEDGPGVKEVGVKERGSIASWTGGAGLVPV